jgi:hypothetical protein
MGLLSKMFGGGTKVELHLDATQVPCGGILSGRTTVHGGKKDLEFTSLTVQLVYVKVTAKDDSPIPDIEMKVLLDNTLVSGGSLPSGSEQEHTFQFQIPTGTSPTGHNVSYKVIVRADIPKVKDPTAEATLKVIEATGAGIRHIDEIYARWPALKGTAEGPLVDALGDFRNECYSDREELIAAEPLLASMIRDRTGEVQRAALEAWGNLLDDQVRKEHLQILGAVADQDDLETETLQMVIEVAAKFADEGGLEYVQRFVSHPDAEIRKTVADKLRFDADDDFKGKKEMILKLAGDEDGGVRASAYGAFSDYRDDIQIMQLCADQIDKDPSPEVQAACISTLCFGHHHGMTDLMFSVYERHLDNPHERVRKEIAENINWLPKEQRSRIQGIVQRLLGDQADEVRRAMAWQFRNLSEFPELAPLLKHAIETDQNDEVRTEGIGSMASVLPMQDAVAYYRGLLAGSVTEPIAEAVVDGLRWKDEPEAKALLQEMTNSPFTDVASSARDALE